MNDSLYEQIKHSLLASELTYAYSLMRELGRRKQLDGPGNNEAALRLPMNAAEFQRIIQANPKLAGVFEGQDEDAALQFTAVGIMKEKSMTDKATEKDDATQQEGEEDEGDEMRMTRMRMTKTIRASILNFQEDVGKVDIAATVEKAFRRGSAATQGTELVYFNDQADKGYRDQTEIVYGIHVDRLGRRVDVVFRGSRTPSDWAANNKFNGKAFPNPVKGLSQFADDSSLPAEVYVHEGFHEYLHRKDGTGEGIFENLLPVLEEHPGYSLWVAGHSLGGALASLFAISAACRDDIPKPVNCITMAQPLHGDIRLTQSVRRLEESNNLLVLRVRNCNDGVPAVPGFSPIPNFAYTHVGMELTMYDDHRSKTIQLSRSDKTWKNVVGNFNKTISLFVLKVGMVKQKKAHTLGEHLRLLEKHEEEIRSLGKNLEDVYSKALSNRQGS